MRNNIIFLPRCLENSQKEFIKDYFSDRDYEIYEVAGGSKVKNIIEKYDFNSLNKVIGIACKDEIMLMDEYASKNNFQKSKIVAIPLEKEGCENTKVNLEDFFSIID